jgi:hypothetical protein
MSETAVTSCTRQLSWFLSIIACCCCVTVSVRIMNLVSDFLGASVVAAGTFHSHLWYILLVQGGFHWTVALSNR